MQALVFFLQHKNSRHGSCEKKIGAYGASATAKLHTPEKETLYEETADG